jgi:hypothetical protein
VKHGYARCPHEWAHSSFHRFVTEQRYERNWCCQSDGPGKAPMYFGDIDRSAGK